MPKDEEYQEGLHEALQRLGMPEGAPPGGAVLVGWVGVLEWMASDGQRWLTRVRSFNIPSWYADGLHHHALHGDWPNDAD